ncbi:MAG: Fe-S cluster assembly protein SufD [Alphaproteobacteria bacterium]|nr:Fe-S cluster assembly protein SufD [Alphaproteobacteria bacterium]
MTLTTQNNNLWGDDIPWLYGLREKAIRYFEQTGFPTAKTEAWKYSYFAENALQNPQIDNTKHECDGHCHCHNKSDLPFEAYEIRFCNGKTEGEEIDLPNGVNVKSLAEAIFDNDIKDFLNKSFDYEDFPFAALNTAYLEQGYVLLIERNTILERPLYLHYHQHDNMNRLCNIRNIIILERGAQATIIEHFDADETAIYFDNVVNEIYLAPESILHHYKWQNEAKNAHHIALNSVQVKANAQYKSLCLQGSCTLARNESYIRLLQDGAKTEIDAIYCLKQQSVSDITTNIRHLATHTFSNQLVKGVVSDAAKGIFQGQIHIAPNAQQTEGYQLHRALLLSDKGEVDCKPELEIFADDVKCSHGATCGDLDKEQLFYLQSRGIDFEQAQQILIAAYLNEVIEKISDSKIKNWLQREFKLEDIL